MSIRLFARSDAHRVAEILRTETTGGLLLIGAAVFAMIWSNSPWSGLYRDLGAVTVGPAAWHLDLTLATWAADGLLAIFFFVAGLELKREFVAGDLRDPRRAVLPVAAAVGGMAVPALLFVAINLSAGGDNLRGWATPTATDIAFALAVLALAVLALVGGNLPAAEYGAWWALLPLAAATWALVHASGVHATVAGVLLAFAVPVRGRDLAGRFEHRWRPISAGIAVPVFAFFAAGVSVGGDLGAALRDPITIGIVVGLVAGKAVGITAATWLVQRFTRAELADDMDWLDVVGLAVLGGIGFTVSLLIGELAYGAGTPNSEHAKLGILLGTVIAVIIGGGLLRARDRHYRRR